METDYERPNKKSNLMKTTLSLIVSVLLCAGYASGAAENPWAAYRYAPDALREMDLASDKDWTLSVDGGAPRPIKVTAEAGTPTSRSRRSPRRT